MSEEPEKTVPTTEVETPDQTPQPAEPQEAEIVIPETVDIDEHLTEEDALAQAAEEGIEFEDFYSFEGAEKEYPTAAAAKKDAAGKPIMQVRRQKSGTAQDFQDAAKDGTLDFAGDVVSES